MREAGEGLLTISEVCISFNGSVIKLKCLRGAEEGNEHPSAKPQKYIKETKVGRIKV